MHGTGACVSGQRTLILAIWPTTEPVAPAAPETRTVSPATSRAVNGDDEPGQPSDPHVRAIGGGGGSGRGRTRLGLADVQQSKVGGEARGASGAQQHARIVHGRRLCGRGARRHAVASSGQRDARGLHVRGTLPALGPTLVSVLPSTTAIVCQPKKPCGVS